MDFVFQGFQSAFPIWGYILLFIGTTALSWWSYHSLRTVPSAYRYGLITLRSGVFFILLTLLINPFFKAETSYYEKPEVLVLMDNSASMAIEKGAYKGTETYKNVLDQLNFDDSSRVNFKFFELDRSIRPSKPDSLSFNGNGTNLFNSYEVIENYQRDITAAVLISDGIFNQGRDPAFRSGSIETPFFTIALGDTTQQKDLIVENVVSNTTGYINTRHPVEVKIVNNGFSRQPFEVQIRKGDRVLDSQTLTPESDISTHVLNFEIDLQEEGLQQFNVTVPPHTDEWTEANNVQPFSIDVLDEKQRILSLAFEVYPDVRMLRSILLQDENSRLIPRTWLSRDRFIEGSMEIDSDSLDLIILQGYPESGLPRDLTKRISSLLREVPSIVMPSPKSSFQALQRNTGFSLPVQQTSPSYAPVNMMAAADPNAHPVMELPQVNLQRMPAVSAPIQDVKLTNGTMLFTSSFQGNETNQPLITVHQIGNLRHTFISGFGWYRTAQSSNQRHREFIDQLFYNLVSWTATKPDNRMLDVKPAQTVFSGEQPIILNAFLTNESGETESEADIGVTISGNDIEQRNYSMTSTGNGQYQLQLNALPEGIYTFEATAQKGNRTIDTNKGEFSVSSSNIEYVNTRRNDLLLRQMAKRSGGSFYTYDQLDGFWNDLEERGILAMEQKTRNDLFYPYQHVFWFILVMGLLTAEWIIRKYLSLP